MNPLHPILARIFSKINPRPKALSYLKKSMQRRGAGALTNAYGERTRSSRKPKNQHARTRRKQGANLAHFQDTIRQKNQEIAFLHAHVSQLTQSIGQFAFKPGEEEIRKKGRWQLWRR
jgi:hypothetical protein